MDELIQLVAERAGIDTEQARIAVATVLRVFACRLPSPVVGQIKAWLDDAERAAAPG